MLTRRLLVTAAAVGAMLTLGGADGATTGPLVLTVTSPCSSGKVCVSWLPVVVDGFEFLRDNVRQDNSWNGALTSYQFAKPSGSGQHVYTVVPITRDFSGAVTYPAPPPLPSLTFVSPASGATLASNPNGIGVDWRPADYTYGPRLS